MSICIPAWERPALLLEAARSALAQSYSSIEIVIADDSRSRSVEHALAPLLPDPRIRYFRNEKRLGQASNVNRLFELARGERLVLLHDDDTLMVDAVERLSDCWRADPQLTACYGRCYIVSHSGVVLPQLTAAVEAAAYRTAEFAGTRPDPLWCVLSEQFPADGFMVLTAAARALKFRPESEVGDACDFDFRLRLAQRSARFHYLHQFVSTYRITDLSISSEPTSIDHAFVIARELRVSAELELVRRRFLAARAAHAARRYLLSGHRQLAWELIWCSDYWPRRHLPRSQLANVLLYMLPSGVAQAWDRLRRSFRVRLRRANSVFLVLMKIRSAR
ncbi:MAG TPA: glycosyltransferase [Burkholderiales bacterium]|nr:glycosyltransferase [Burkholderiales bacterium]